VVWANTRSIACAQVKSLVSHQYHVACVYSPYGNVLNAFENNVPRPLSIRHPTRPTNPYPQPDAWNDGRPRPDTRPIYPQPQPERPRPDTRPIYPQPQPERPRPDTRPIYTQPRPERPRPTYPQPQPNRWDINRPVSPIYPRPTPSRPGYEQPDYSSRPGTNTRPDYGNVGPFAPEVASAPASVSAPVVPAAEREESNTVEVEAPEVPVLPVESNVSASDPYAVPPARLN
jgi:hypothetical protein